MCIAGAIVSRARAGMLLCTRPEEHLDHLSAGPIVSVLKSNGDRKLSVPFLVACVFGGAG